MFENINCFTIKGTIMKKPAVTRQNGYFKYDIDLVIQREDSNKCDFITLAYYKKCGEKLPVKLEPGKRIEAYGKLYTTDKDGKNVMQLFCTEITEDEEVAAVA